MGTTSNIFKNYINPVFFETGSYFGDSIQFALDSGFKEIYSIELSEYHYNYCVDRFKNNKNVNIIFGDSCEKLFDSIKDINTDITFWLDGHYSCGDTALGKYWAPLIQELEQIKKHKLNNHTILIDDMQYWTDQYIDKHGFNKNDLIKELYEINSNYNISFIDGAVENDILVCKINK